MANTWRATSQGIAWASGKSMLDVFNAAASSRFIRVYRMYLFNNGTASVSGVLTEVRVTRITAASGGTGVTPVAHDTSNAALNANTTAGTGRTVTDDALFRQLIYSNDEPAVSGSSMDEWELLVPFAEIWNSGYGDSNVQPLTAVSGTAQGYHIKNQGTTAVGSASAEIEFTDSAS